MKATREGSQGSYFCRALCLQAANGFRQKCAPNPKCKHFGAGFNYVANAKRPKPKKVRFRSFLAPATGIGLACGLGLPRSQTFTESLLCAASPSIPLPVTKKGIATQMRSNTFLAPQTKCKPNPRFTFSFYLQANKTKALQFWSAFSILTNNKTFLALVECA